MTDMDEKFCNYADEEINNLMKSVLKAKELNQSGAEVELMRQLKTTLYNRHHLCGSLGGRLASRLPPPPHKIPEEIREFAEGVEQRME